MLENYIFRLPMHIFHKKCNKTCYDNQDLKTRKNKSKLKFRGFENQTYYSFRNI